VSAELVFAELAGCRPVWQEELEGWTVTESRLLNRAIESRELQLGREWLLDCLQERLAAELTPEVIEAINKQPSLALLRSWHKAAVGVKSYDDFLAVLRQ
jgi:hypothetical protein